MSRSKPDTAKIHTTDRGQTVQLPLRYRFTQQEVFIRKDPATGDVILSERADRWAELMTAQEKLDTKDNFPDREQQQPPRS